MSFLLRYAKQYKLEMLVAPLFKLLEACFELLVPLVIAAIIDTIIPTGNRDYLVASLLVLVGLASSGVLVSLIAQYFSAKAAVGVTELLTQDLYAKILSLSKTQQDSLSSDSLFTRISSDTLQIQSGINLFLRLFLRAPIIVFGSLGMAVYLRPNLSLYFLGMIVLLFGLVVWLSNKTNHHYGQMRTRLDKLVGQIRETISGLRPIRAFGQEKEESQRFSRLNQAYRNQQLRASLGASFVTPLTFLVVHLTLILLIWQGNAELLEGEFEIGQLIALVHYLLQILVELMKLVMVLSQLHQSLIACQRVNEIWTQESEDLLTSLPVALSNDEKDHLLLHQLTFTYPAAAKPALQSITLHLKKGQWLGIIGGTGSGKTTLIQLLMGLYPVAGDSLRIFQQGRSPKNLAEWRRHCRLVPQESQLFAGTIASNLRLGQPEASEDQLWEALELAKAADFVREKGGLYASVAPFGRNFSGGQRQRLAIARAIVDSPPLLILDDATSALDPLTESRLLAALRKSPAIQTVVIVSQRTQSLEDVDQILVLDKGRQVGLGHHNELLVTSRIYQEIHQSQRREEEKA